MSEPSLSIFASSEKSRIFPWIFSGSISTVFTLSLYTQDPSSSLRTITPRSFRFLILLLINCCGVTNFCISSVLIIPFSFNAVFTALFFALFVRTLDPYPMAPPKPKPIVADKPALFNAISALNSESVIFVSL